MPLLSPLPVRLSVTMTTESAYLSAWPSGLQNLTVFFSLPTEQVDFPFISGKLASAVGVEVRGDRVSATLSDSSKKLHAHLRMRISTGSKWRIELVIYPGQSSNLEDHLSIDDFLELLNEVTATSDRDVAGSAIAQFEFESARWTSEVPLPITLPGLFETSAGSPQITGFEFTFQENSSGILRAFISKNEFVKRYRLNCQVLLATGSLRAIVGLALATSTEKQSLFGSIIEPDAGIDRDA